MSDVAIEDPCIVFALGRESRAFRREFRPHQRFPGAPCWARFAGPAWLPVLLVETGVGPVAAGRTFDWLLASPLLGNVPYRPKLVLSAGFAGALRDDLGVGDVVLATEVVDADGNCWPTTWPSDLGPGEWRPLLHRGRVVTVSEVAATAAAKRELAARHGAVVVDMESAVVARTCSRQGVPFGCLRAVSDDSRTGLSPRLVSLLRGGRVSPARLLAAVVRSPGITRELWRLARDTRRAGEQLAKALGELLTLTLPWGADL